MDGTRGLFLLGFLDLVDWTGLLLVFAVRSAFDRGRRGIETRRVVGELVIRGLESEF